MESFKKDVILLTGATGYIGSHVAQVFVERCVEDYKIRIALRELDPRKLEILKKIFGQDSYDQIEFVQADLKNKDDIQKVVKGVSYIIHCASATGGDITTPDQDQISLTKEGTSNLLEQASQEEVKRIVFTMHACTMIGPQWKTTNNQSTYDENDFCPIEKVKDMGIFPDCIISKENIIKDFVQRQKNSQHQIEIVTLHPAFVLGPTYFYRDAGAPNFLSKFVTGEIPVVPNLQLPAVDVRDVAEAHYQAFKAENISYERIILAQETYSAPKMMLEIQEEFKKYGYKVSTRQVGYYIMKVASWLNDQVKGGLPLVDQLIFANNEKSIEILELEYNRNLKQSAIELIYSLIDVGLVPDLRKNI